MAEGNGKAKAAAGIAGAAAFAFGLYVGLLQDKEGTKLQSYQDGVGIWTICTGDTHNVRPGMIETPDGCRNRLSDQARYAWDATDDLVTAPMTYGQQIAYSDYIYNAGRGSFSGSLMLGYANASRLQESCDAFLNYMMANHGRVDCRIRSNGCYGVVTRRQDERKICLGTNPDTKQ